MGNRRDNNQYWGSKCLSADRPSSTQSTSGATWQQPTQGSAQQQGVDTASIGSSDAQPQNQQPMRPVIPVYTSGKDHVVAGLLGIFLGGFGIHKFYLGYNSAAFIMLGVSILGSIFTLGLAGMVMWVIGVIEGIIYLAQDQGSFDHTYVYNMKEWF